MTRSDTLFLADILVNAGGAMVIVFMAFISRQGDAINPQEPVVPSAKVLEANVSGNMTDAIVELTLGGAVHRATHSGVSDWHSPAEIEPVGRLETVGEAGSPIAARLGPPVVHRTDEGVVVLAPCPPPGPAQLSVTRATHASEDQPDFGRPAATIELHGAADPKALDHRCTATAFGISCTFTIHDTGPAVCR